MLDILFCVAFILSRTSIWSISSEKCTSVEFRSKTCLRLIVEMMCRSEKMCISETCFILALCNLRHTEAVSQLNTKFWSIKICWKRLKVRKSCISLFLVCWSICLLFSNKSRANSNAVIYVFEMHIFQNGTLRQSAKYLAATCFRTACNTRTFPSGSPRGRTAWWNSGS